MISGKFTSDVEGEDVLVELGSPGIGRYGGAENNEGRQVVGMKQQYCVSQLADQIKKKDDNSDDDFFWEDEDEKKHERPKFGSKLSQDGGKVGEDGRGRDGGEPEIEE